MLLPSHPVPNLVIETLDHGPFTLSQSHGPNGTFLVFYRGLHCPICIKQMTAFEAAMDDFAALGVSVLMLSADDEARASTKSGPSSGAEGA